MKSAKLCRPKSMKLRTIPHKLSHSDSPTFYIPYYMKLTWLRKLSWKLLLRSCGLFFSFSLSFILSSLFVCQACVIIAAREKSTSSFAIKKPV